MSVDKATVKRIAHLARIRIEDDALAPLARELTNILAFVEQLNALDTTDVPPMTSAVEHGLHWRKDEVTDGRQAEAILANAPASELGFFAVPKVIE